MSTRDTPSPARVERRRRWKKRHEFDLAYRMAQVKRGEGHTLGSGLYRCVDVCTWTAPENAENTIGERPVKHHQTIIDCGRR